MSDQSMLGRVLWVELMTTDTERAKAFYQTVVGWTITPFEGMGIPYAMWTRPDGGSMGGVMMLPDDLRANGVPPHWMMYVGTPSLDATVGHVERLGGAALSPILDLPNVGRVRTMRDPQGAGFSLYEPASPPAAEGEPAVGDVSWIELMTTDVAGALAFYRELFGWKDTESMDMGPMGVYQMFGRNATSMGGIMLKPKEMEQVPPNWTLYVRVPDVQTATASITANGGKVLNGPMEVPGGDFIVQGMDPQGAAFALHARKA